ncbi:MAG: hypothetical protein ABI254_11800 [Chthoniobacterales bacterium]
MRRLGIFIGFIIFLVVAYFIVGILFTPWAWHLSDRNLRIVTHNEISAQNGGGRESLSVGWSKWEVLCGHRWSMHTQGMYTAASPVTTDFNIVSASPSGVTIRVRYDEKRNGKTTISYDRLIFVPAHDLARVDVSKDIYITGAFELTIPTDKKHKQ